MSRTQKTLAAIFADPTPANLAWRDIEAALISVGATVTEASGSRLRVHLNDVVQVFNRPHPRPPSLTACCAGSARFLDPCRSQAVNNQLHYKGYTVEVEYDAEDQVLHGRVLGIQDVVHFEADAASEVEAAFHASVDDYLDYCRELGREPQKSLPEPATA